MNAPTILLAGPEGAGDEDAPITERRFSQSLIDASERAQADDFGPDTIPTPPPESGTEPATITIPAPPPVASFPEE